MTKEKIKELGWQFDGVWANRALFSKKDGKLEGFTLFEHDGDWGIMDPYAEEFELIYCNMSNDEIIQYINYINSIEEMYEHPKDHTFYEYICFEKDIKKFIANMKERS